MCSAILLILFYVVCPPSSNDNIQSDRIVLCLNRQPYFIQISVPGLGEKDGIAILTQIHTESLLPLLPLKVIC